jgi:HD superfamily phosphohydrolase
MKGKHKIFNDPVYGFISIPYGPVFDLIEHPAFQRLRRIRQLGLTHYVYPGALHTRFHHALGAVHLMSEALDVLKSKGVDITDAETEAAIIAILLHDIGHGPFSHALEHRLVKVHHEDLTTAIMQQLNEEFGGKLSLAIQIFEDKYEKLFLHQLVSGQLDMDRLDYLSRDSFFTGVHEGVVGYDRIIKMLDVRDNKLVVEEKGLYSIEKFLIARRLMYWQAYLHKTVLGAEFMLIHAIERARKLTEEGVQLPLSPFLDYFLSQNIDADYLEANKHDVLEHFIMLDDFDVISALKNFTIHPDVVLSTLSKGIIYRKLFKVEQDDKPFPTEYKQKILDKIKEKYHLCDEEAASFVITTAETNTAYNKDKDEIQVLYKNGEVRPVSAWLEQNFDKSKVTRYFLCYPKDLDKE